MPKIRYQDMNFRTATLLIISECNKIIAEYAAMGFALTLRQLYYQLVSRDIIPNNIKEYNKLGNAVSDGRLAGLIDWNAIEDRTRSLRSIGHWNTPGDFAFGGYNQYHIDKWADQKVRCEVWIEKEALAGVFARICNSLDVPYLSCKGYTSQSEMWGAAMRFVKYLKDGKSVQVFHFGDHDPSGIDMTRDIEDRLRMFISGHTSARKFNLTRVALNMDQVEQYDPPENPAKTTDTRFDKYQEAFGDSSWELDALNPTVLAGLVSANIGSVRDDDTYQVKLEQEARDRAVLITCGMNWEVSILPYIEKTFTTDLEVATETELAKLQKDEADAERFDEEI